MTGKSLETNVFNKLGDELVFFEGHSDLGVKGLSLIHI